MKSRKNILRQVLTGKRIRALTVLCPVILSLHAETEALEDALSEELIQKQDYLSGDVQELIEVQTQEGVIQKLEQVETGMVEATLALLEGDTGGETIAIQTEIIENAYEAAKEKQKSQSGQSDTDKALMDMLKNMMGESDGQGQGEKKGEKKGDGEGEGDQAGKGQTGDGNPDTAETSRTSTEPTGSVRTVPHASGTTGELLPQEFQELIDDYNQKK